MRLVVALGGNALLRRGEVPAAEIQQHHIDDAVTALAVVARANDVVVTHGNGPQVGLLAVESAADASLPSPYPFDVLGAQTQGMIGYWLLQALENALPGRQVSSLVTQTLVDGSDPAFSAPTKFVGQILDEREAADMVARFGWEVRADGGSRRRVVPSPEPVEMLELATIRALLEGGAVVVCAGGGGIPVVRDSSGQLRGVEAVIDKDLSAALLAEQLGADALVMLTDVSAVEVGFGTPAARPLHEVSVAELRAMDFAAGSMGPKVEAACRFAEATGNPSMIGSLEDVAALLDGTSGTIVRARRGTA
jgi:carbamate kinase